MIRAAWSGISPLLGKVERAAVTILAIGSVVVGLLEAALLVLVVSAAVTIAEGDAGTDLGLPLIGELALSPSKALAVAAAAGLVLLVLHVALAWVMERLSAGVLRFIRDRAVRGFIRASWERQAEVREGALQETVSTLAVQSSNITVHLSVFASSLIALGVLLVAALMVDPVVTGVVLVFGTLLFLGLRPLAGLTRGLSREHVRKNSTFNERVSQWSALAMELRVFGVEDAEIDRLANSNADTSRAMVRSRFAMRAGSQVFRDVAILFLIGAVAALNAFEVELAAVGAVVLLVVRCLNYAQAANTAMQHVNDLGPNLESLFDRLQSLEAAAVSYGSRSLDGIGKIELDAVDYDYSPGRTGIEQVSLTIGAGEALGVIGPSGGGKSTLVQVLLRLRLPTSGTVTVSGVPYEEIDSADWHRSVALVPQEPKLFEGSVADNISFFRPGFTPHQIAEAAASAHVLDDIHRLPGGFGTMLGPRGAGLSGGQKQRVAIARALLGSPDLLVLDEPTSALDVRSEQLLQKTIAGLKGRTTMVLVAHRLSTLGVCDRVAAMENGRIQLVGTLDEALAEVSFVDDLIPGAESEL